MYLSMFQWYPEIKYFNRKAPILLVGTKLDLLGDIEAIRRLKKENIHPVSLRNAVKMQKKIGAVRYLECSARTQMGLKAVFEEVIRTVVKGVENTPEEELIKQAEEKRFNLNGMFHFLLWVISSTLMFVYI